jgi:flavin-dependent dehydrogenase
LSYSAAAVVHADVGIIGAGPAGLATAVHLGQLGIERVVIVDRLDFPRDKTCGSAVSPKCCAVLNGLGVSEAVERESYTISGLRLVTPRGHDVIMSSPQDVALICNRRTLDHLLLQRGQQCGARFLGNFEASHLLQRGDRVVGFRSADGREVRAEYIDLQLKVRRLLDRQIERLLALEDAVNIGHGLSVLIQYI